MERINNEERIDYSNEIEQIISYLNLKTGRKYSEKAGMTYMMVKMRLTEGFRVEDFKKVIDNKCDEWLGTDMEKYIRPNTLFKGRHFDEYLNQPKEIKKVEKEPIPIFEIDDDIIQLNILNASLVNKYKTMNYNKYLLTDHWVNFKKATLINANHSCRLCGAKGIELNVHHNNYENRGCETFNDVIVLCKSCHAKFHDK